VVDAAGVVSGGGALRWVAVDEDARADCSVGVFLVADTLACVCRCHRFCAATSQGSSVVWNCEQVRLRNRLMRRPNSLVRDSR